jgi:hypothetical protein
MNAMNTMNGMNTMNDMNVMTYKKCYNFFYCNCYMVGGLEFTIILNKNNCN